MDTKPITVLTILGARSEIIRMSPVVNRLGRHKSFNSIVVSVSQEQELNDDLYDLFSIKPDCELNSIKPGLNMAETTSRLVSELTPVLRECNPDMALVQGDKLSAFIGALCCNFQNIPLGHVEAGHRCQGGTELFFEERIRKMITGLSDLHFTPSRLCAINLQLENVNPESVFITGNTIVDSLIYLKENNKNSLSRYVPSKVLQSGRMILVTCQNPENWGQPLENLCHALSDLEKKFDDIEIVFPVQNDTAMKNIVFKLLADKDRIHLLNVLPYATFIEAMEKARFIITDSKRIQESGPAFQKPILLFRDVSHEAEGIATGGAKFIGRSREAVVSEMSHFILNPLDYLNLVAEYNPFGDGYASERIVQALLYQFDQGKRPQNYKNPERSIKNRSYPCTQQMNQDVSPDFYELMN